ncbi:DUF6584 family protein [Streptomyces pilosus]|uniref:DUF6584 family protein n=1 Tax=Streptomyces pilosus TaxID=28893 RepID=UPI0036377A7C
MPATSRRVSGPPSRPARRKRTRGAEGLAPSGFAVEQLTAVRAACSEALGRPVDWDSVPSARDDGPEAGGGGLSGLLVGAGCLTVLLGMVGIWVYGLIALVG